MWACALAVVPIAVSLAQPGATGAHPRRDARGGSTRALLGRPGFVPALTVSAVVLAVNQCLEGEERVP